ncbi:OmpA/MotB protein [Actibacterium atlanticum]|uniref:OmpA/MotB protein n=1 Tax=Actibacterium atlanticum TaxID=1461693 RepID=A0A058ZQG1_9RHOB|nr:OmpA family protein [Actibacterium atlanticum]KCV83091.1 OmpA/MotB protein [Actibacterium atlanticum]
MRAKITLLSVAALTGLGACSPSSVTNFYTEAGASLDGGDFGNSTMGNFQAMTGDGAAIVNLSRRFSTEANTTINFAFNSAALDAQAQQTLRQQAAWIAQYPQVRFRVYGHTDKVGSNNYNKRLGLRRAQTAVSYLVSQGIDRSRLEAVVSFGETQPLVHTESQERANRRTVTEVSGFIKPREQTLDGKYALFNYDEYVRSAYESVPGTTVENDSDGAAEER